MRIVRFIYDWPPPWSGLAPHPYEITLGQVRRGHTVTVFCGRWLSAGPLEVPMGVTVIPFPREPFPGTLNVTTSVMFFLYYLLWRKTNEVDIIHSHGHFGIWYYLYRIFLMKFFPAARELQTPVVVHFHNTVAGRKETVEEKGVEIKPYSKLLAWPLAELSDRWAIGCSSANIFVSEDTKNQAIKLYGADPAKCYVVESGVNTTKFMPVGVEEKEKTRRDLGLDQFDKVVLYNGYLVERKNPHLLIQALKYLPDAYKLVFVGAAIDQDYLYKMRSMVEQFSLADRIVWVGYTPYPEIPISYQAADVLVLPSSWEGLPKAVMESLACGVPALVSGFKLGESIEGLVYLDRLEPQYLATRIKEVVEGGVSVDVSKIADLYSWDTRVEKIETIYKKLLVL